jgi:hypothetical protein
MRIEKLEIKGFGKLKNVSMTLDKGINIVFGSNEAGKSTLQWFIRAMLFGLKGGKASREGVLPPLKRFKPWSGEDYAGFLEYRLDDDRLFRVGRNFGTNSARVFDSLFNDITNSFDVSRDKGINLADKHLGLNELCFDKTVFIRQMEAKIGEDGSRELYNRIMNISETGFEDVSFKKAQEALKNALRIYVGTDKTSTRPLDKVVGRLSELGVKREELINTRTSLFTIDNDLSEAITSRIKLQKRKSFLEKVKEHSDLQSRLKKNTQLMRQIQEILESIDSDEKEMRLIEEKASEFSRAKKEFSIFSTYDTEDVDGLDSNYQKLLDKINENRKLRFQIDAREKEIDKNRAILAGSLAFSELGEGIENKIILIVRELDQLKKEYEKGNPDNLNKNIEITKKRAGSYTPGIIISVAAAVGLAGLGVMGVMAGYAGAAAAIILTSVLMYLKGKFSRELASILDEKRMSFINVNGIKEEINKKQSVLDSIYRKVGAAGVEDFLRLKAQYDAESRVVAALNGEINRLESECSILEREISIYKGKILSRLIEAELIESGKKDFDEEHIKFFKNGVRRYKGIEPSINYTSQRLEDANKSIEKHYKSAAAICGSEFANKDCLINKLSELETEHQKLKKAIAEITEQISGQLHKDVYTGVFPKLECPEDELNINIFNTNLSSVYPSMEEEYKKVCGELESTALNIREYETLIKGLNGSESESQKIEEEIEELKVSKSRLEDINISLKTALDVLTEASQEIQKDFVPLLNQRMADAVKRFTAGKYYDLRADSSLALNVISPETGDIIAVSSLSGGTADQMYLALRLSAADMISGTGEKLPLIMDEVFAQYDDVRTKETFEYLKELSQQRQIIFFTCKGREVEIARQVYNNVNIIEIN